MALSTAETDTIDTSSDLYCVADFGSRWRLSGFLFQGEGRNLILLSPTADMWVDPNAIEVAEPLLRQWQAILDRTDDPALFIQGNFGPVLKGWHRKQEFAISGAVQQSVWARDNFQCLYCGKMMGETQLTIDHFEPLEAGGANDTSNYVSACRACNKRKGGRDPKEFCGAEGLDHDGLVAYLDGKASIFFIAHLNK